MTLMVVGVSIMLDAPRVAAAGNLETVSVPGQAPGLTFDGVGTISAGGESRLLLDYPRSKQQQIMDFMFCTPLVRSRTGRCERSKRYAVAAQTFTVEMGGDGNASVGAEPSFLRDRSEFERIAREGPNPRTCHLKRGYEWRLMRGAVQRDPKIKFNARPWPVPGYLNYGRFYGPDTIKYHVAFAECAVVNGTPLSTIGVRNETPYFGSPNGKEWIIELRRALDLAGRGEVKIVAWDGAYQNVVNDIASDPQFRRSVGVVGTHYGLWKSITDVSTYNLFSSPPEAQDLRARYGTQMWTTEAGGLDWAPTGPTRWDGARFYAQQLLRYYVQAKNTAVWMVAALDSYDLAFEFAPDGLPHPGNGMIEANTPWSGRYEILPADWVMGHITQFTWPRRWRYIDGASCLIDDSGHDRCATAYLGPDQAGVQGSFVTLRERHGTNWTTVLQTEPGFRGRSYRFCPDRELRKPARMQLWTTNTRTEFTRSAVPKEAGCYEFRAEPDAVYTLTTVTSGHKGQYRPAPAKPLSLPYRDDFDHYRQGSTPRYLSDLNGRFETVAEGTRHFLSQVVTRAPIPWFAVDSDPDESDGADAASSFIGDLGGAGASGNWCGYSTAVKVRIRGAQGAPNDGKPGFAGLVARWSGYAGYTLRLYQNGNWELIVPNRETVSGTIVTGSGWHDLAMRIDGDAIIPMIDGQAVHAAIHVESTDAQAHECGLVGLESGWNRADFDDLAVR